MILVCGYILAVGAVRILKVSIPVKVNFWALLKTRDIITCMKTNGGIL